jgi:hypothetical protein
LCGERRLSFLPLFAFFWLVHLRPRRLPHSQ